MNADDGTLSIEPAPGNKNAQPLPKYDENGQRYTYTLKETALTLENVPNSKLVYLDPVINTYLVENGYRSIQGALSVKKFLELPTDEDGEQYQTYFLNMVDETDLLAAMQAAGGELPECSCVDKCAVGAINADCAVCAVNMSECQGKAPEPAPVVEPEPDPEPEQPKATGSGGMLLLALAVVVIGGGAGWYFKIYRPKKQRAAESEADYGGEYDGAENYDETDPEDDGPPWDEDGEE